MHKEDKYDWSEMDRQLRRQKRRDLIDDLLPWGCCLLQIITTAAVSIFFAWVAFMWVTEKV